MNAHQKELVSGSYAIRLGKTVPPDANNISYIGNTQPNVTSGAVYLTDNEQLTNTREQETRMYANENHQLTNNQQENLIYTKEILLTDVFTEDAGQEPLYYHYQAKGYVRKVFSGTYVGNDIVVRKVQGTMHPHEKYKIVLTPINTESSSVTVCTNFKGTKTDIFQLVYNKYENNVEKNNHEELLNLSPVYQEVPRGLGIWPNPAHLNQKVYALEAVGQGYRVLVNDKGQPSPPNTRIPVNFSYKIDINSDVAVSQASKSTLNIGIISVTEQPGLSTQDTLLVLQGRLPSYLTLKNPHPFLSRRNERHTLNWIDRAFDLNRNESSYWQANIGMPLDHYYSYDLLIIAGSGRLVLSQLQRDNIQKFLEHGGNIWIDNNGTSTTSSLSLGNFPLGFTFVNTGGSGTPLLNNQMNFLSRYFAVTRDVAFNPAWHTTFTGIIPTNIISLGTTFSKLAFYEYQNRGRVIFSADSVMSGISVGDLRATQLATNVCLRIAEHKWETTGFLNSNVLNKFSVLDIDQDSSLLTMPYMNGYDNHGTQIVALRQLTKTLKNTTENHTKRNHTSAKYYIATDNTDVFIAPEKNFYGDHDILHSYTHRDTAPWHTLSPNSTTHMTYPDVFFNYTVEAFIYRPATEGHTARLSFNEIRTRLHSGRVSAKDGILTLGFLSTLLPGTGSGSDWVDRSLIYYRIRVGRYANGIWQEGSKHLNLAIYNNSDGHYFVSRDGTLTISATEIAPSMVLHASTNYHNQVIQSNQFVTKEQETPIYLAEPAYMHESSPWFLRIRNAEFNTTSNIARTSQGIATAGLTQTNEYTLPEFSRQAFMPHGQTQIRQRQTEIAEFIDNDLIRISHTPLVVSVDMPITIIKRQYSQHHIKQVQLVSIGNNVFRAEHKNWLTRPAPIIYDTDVAVNPALYAIDYNEGTVTFFTSRSDITADYAYTNDIALTVKEYDSNSGVIRINESIDYTDTVLVTYHYDEKYLTYTGYMDGARFWHLDLNPAPGHIITFPVIDANRNVVPTDIDTHRLLGRIIYVYLLPHKVGNAVNQHTVRHTFNENEWLIIKASNPTAILLGKVQVREGSTVHDLTSFDTRQRGGGLKKDISTETMKSVADKHSQILDKHVPPVFSHYWDMTGWNGRAYQQQGNFVVAIPKQALKEFGGRFANSEEIHGAIKKHLALGVTPILDYTELDRTKLQATILIRNADTLKLQATIQIR